MCDVMSPCTYHHHAGPLCWVFCAADAFHQQFDGKMDGAKYRLSLKESLLEAAKGLRRPQETKNIHVLEWSSQRPDVNKLCPFILKLSYFVKHVCKSSNSPRLEAGIAANAGSANSSFRKNAYKNTTFQEIQELNWMVAKLGTVALQQQVSG